VRLLRLLRWMAPNLPPMYRGFNIARPTLPGLAHSAMNDAGHLPEALEELWNFDLLRLLAAGGGDADSELDGGDGLDRLDAQWRDQWRVWSAACGYVTDPEARAVLDDTDSRARRGSLALCLWVAAADENARVEMISGLRQHARRFRLPWFAELVHRPETMWVAYRLRFHAQLRAEERNAREEAARVHRAWLAENEAIREWSRRQNRPAALPWAVAGLFVMGAVLALLISVSDIAGPASNATILDAWVAAAFSLTAALAAEGALAWEIGGPFHPRYSMLGNGFILLGRAASSIVGRGIALGVIAAVLGAAYLLTAFFPVAAPLVAGGGVLIWATARYSSWSRDHANELADAEQGRRELDAAAAREAEGDGPSVINEEGR